MQFFLVFSRNQILVFLIDRLFFSVNFAFIFYSFSFYALRGGNSLLALAEEFWIFFQRNESLKESKEGDNIV